MQKPVLYLDVDGVLWDLPRDVNGKHCASTPIGAKGVREFIHFALEHFEVRWCTTWAKEHYWLAANHWQDNYFYTDVFEDQNALVRTTEALKIWLQTPNS